MIVNISSKWKVIPVTFYLHPWSYFYICTMQVICKGYLDVIQIGMIVLIFSNLSVKNVSKSYFNKKYTYIELFVLHTL